jgi:hypothetical protein
LFLAFQIDHLDIEINNFRFIDGGTGEIQRPSAR